jgi:ATP-dependent helicase/nuclease subunit A
VRDALKGHCKTEPADAGDGEVLRFRKTISEAVAPDKKSSERTPSISIPAWLNKPVADASLRTAPVRPSGTRIAAPGELPDARQRALARGILTHRLLQWLPDMRSEDRTRSMQDFLARQSGLDTATRSALAEQVMRVLEDPRFAELFVPGGRAEVPIVGRIETGGKRTRVSGQVDRLVVTKEAVLIGDFKTGRPATQRLENYVRQLAEYRAVLKKLYPDRPIRAALVWTEVPELMELSAADMDAALARVTSA